jgi:eukaryotic-like serine/threonine-protein kinase
MESAVLFQGFQDRLAEARFYLEQGLDDGEIIRGIQAEVEQSELPESQKQELLLLAESALNREIEEPAAADPVERIVDEDPSQHFNYGLALMDGQFWDEAIKEFRTAAELGFEPLKCWEYCGDCAAKMAKWDEAFPYYNRIYSKEDIPEDLRKHILIKITKCSQTQKKEDVQTKNGSVEEPPQAEAKSEFVNSSISSLDSLTVSSIVGKTVSSWESAAYGCLPGSSHVYRVTNLHYVGSSSLIVELEDQDTGSKYAGQNLTGRFGQILSPEQLATWARHQMMADSRHLVKIIDLAHSDGYFFIVRERFPLSLNDIITAGGTLPIELAVRIAYQILEALGDLHLHMGKDETIRNTFHLDLRPSRVLLRKDRPCAKIYNGGLWREMERTARSETAPAKLPLPYLSYRAPEQFRPYLSRKRPPIFTDIYLFGAIFYEMLAGTPAFKASSYGESEIQHCEQYPSPPKVWRSEIPDLLNEMIMKCLECDPTKRWRSTTQMSLILEKSYSGAIGQPKDDSYQKYLEKIKLI